MAALARLIFVRHGQTDWNLQGRYQGRADIELCAMGLASARRIAARLRGRRVGLLLTSPLRRAGATAALIGAALGDLPCRVDERLTEIDFGAWQGLTQEEIKARWPQLLRSWKRAPETARFPDGERLEDARERMSDFLRRPPWGDAGGEPCVVAVCHAGPIRIAGLLAEGRPLGDFRRQLIEAGAAYEFEWRAGGELRQVICTQ